MADDVTPVTSDTSAAVRDHSRQFERYTFVYPVISRRSRGLSIGVNLNPDKRCNFDCIYCEVDRRIPGLKIPADPEKIRAELTTMVRAARAGELGQLPKFADVAELTRHVRDIAFSGDGEPTMVPNFSQCVEVVAEVKRVEDLTDTKLVLITDAAGLDKLDVRRGLEIMDRNNGEIWGKLDAGTESYYRTVNRSAVRFERILNNLTLTAQVRPIVIQTLFLRVHGERMPDSELAAYCQRLNDIVARGGRIRAVQAYTVARPTPEAFATALTAAELDGIASRIRTATGLKVLTFA